MLIPLSLHFKQTAIAEEPLIKVRLVAAPNLIPADGKSYSNLYAEVTDQDGNPLEGFIVEFFTTKGKLLVKEAFTDEHGIAKVRLTAPRKRGRAKVRAVVSAGDLAFEDSVTVRFGSVRRRNRRRLGLQAAPSARAVLKVHWVTNKLTNAKACAANGWTVAGSEAKVELYLFITPNGNSIMGVSASGSYVENMQHSNSLSGTLSFSSATANTSDPCYKAPQPGETLYYFEALWPTTSLHNSTADPVNPAQVVDYTLSASYTYNWMNMQGQSGQGGGSAQIKVKVGNLLISVTSPPLLFWDPDNPANSQTTIIGSMSDAQVSKAKVTYRIYDLARANGSGPIKEHVQQGLACPGDFSWTWDGVLYEYVDPMTGQLVKVYAENGVYAYDVVAQDELDMTDNDRKVSAYLTIEGALDESGQQVFDAEYYDYDDKGTTDTTDDDYLYFVRYYVLKDRGGRDASSGEIWLYDPDFVKVGSWDVSGLLCLDHNANDGLKASAAGTRHSVVVRVPVGSMTKPGHYRFVLHLKDTHTDQEKGHRIKPPLELNQVAKRRGLVLWIDSEIPITEITQADLNRVLDEVVATFGNGYVGGTTGLKIPSTYFVGDLVDPTTALGAHQLTSQQKSQTRNWAKGNKVDHFVVTVGKIDQNYHMYAYYVPGSGRGTVDSPAGTKLLLEKVSLKVANGEWGKDKALWALANSLIHELTHALAKGENHHSPSKPRCVFEDTFANHFLGRILNSIPHGSVTEHVPWHDKGEVNAILKFMKWPTW